MTEKLQGLKLRRVRRVARGAWIGLFFCVALLGVASPGAADEYTDATDAIQKQAWGTAIELLDRAIADKPQARAGGMRRRYLPYYYLGVAHYGAGNCQAAVATWGKSLAQNAVREVPELLADLQKKQSDCDARRTKLGELQAQIRLGDSLLAEVAILGESLKTSWERGSRPSPKERHAEAGGALEVARKVATKSTLPSVQEGEQARQGAAGAVETLGLLKGELVQIGSAAEDRAESARRRLAAAVARARGVLDGIEGDLAPGSDTASKVEEIQSLIASAERAKASGNPSQLDQLRGQLGTATGEMDELLGSEVAPELVEAAEAFFSGDYSRVLEILEGETAPELASIDGALLRSAAYFSLYALGGEQDELLRDAARAAALECSAADGEKRPSDDYFSPRFIEFFDAQGSEALEPDEGAEAPTEAAEE